MGEREEGGRAEGGVARGEGEERKSTKGSGKERSRRLGGEREMWMHEEGRGGWRSDVRTVGGMCWRERERERGQERWAAR